MNNIRRNISIIFVFAVMALPALIVGCNTTQQRTTYNTLGALEATATAAVDGYYAATIKGLAPTNGIPTVSKAFNEFQASFVVAIDLAQNNSNVLADTNLQQEAADVITAVTQFFPTTSVKQITPTP
jgi:uncharacterized lipoprotein NlpE involved in copper resistance